MASKFSLEAILSLTDNLTKPYKSTTNRITALNKGLTGSFGRLNTGINKTIAFAGKGLLRAGQIGIGAMAAGVVLATGAFIDLDDSITNAGAKFKDLVPGTEQYKNALVDLSKSARDVGKDTEFSAVDAAGALDKFAMAGVNSEQAMALLKGTTDLATAAGTDLTTAVDIATDSLGAFNLMTDDTAQLQKNLAKVSDQMAKTTTTSNTSLSELFEAVGKGASTFTSAGQSMATFNSFAGILANSSKKGGEAGTALRNVMLRLSKPTGEATSVLDSMGVSLSDSKGNFRDIIDIIADFEKGLDGMGSKQRTAAIATVFGTKTTDAFNLLLQKGSKGLRTYREEIEKSAGASRTMADAIRNSLGNKIKVLKSGLTELGLKFIDAFDKQGRSALDKIITSIQNFDMNIVIDAVNKTIEVFKKLGSFIVEHKDLIKGLVITLGLFKAAVIAVNIVQAIQMGLMAAAPILSMIKVLMSLAKTEGILATAQLALNMAMTANPMGLIVVGVMAAIAALVALGVIIYKNRDAIASFFIAIKDLVVKGFMRIAPILEIIGRGFMTYLLAPINLVISALAFLLGAINRIPGVAGKLDGALAGLKDFQDTMNSVTLQGMVKNESITRAEAPLPAQSQGAIPPSALQAIEREKAQQDREIKQRYDINLNAPQGYSMGPAGETPTTSVSLGDQ